MARRILLVEDDEPLRNALARLLARIGYEVMEAPNGRGAMEQMLRQPADLVVTDMLMPEMEGAETILTLRRLYPSVKVIAISGGGISAPETHLAIARALGARRVMIKPLLLLDFLEAVREVMETN